MKYRTLFNVMPLKKIQLLLRPQEIGDSVWSGIGSRFYALYINLNGTHDKVFNQVIQFL